MNPGLRRHPLILEQPIMTPDGGGGFSRNWLPMGRCWAAIEVASGHEVNHASRQAQRITHRVTLRAGGVRPRADQRFRLRSRVLTIRAVFDRDGRGRTLSCLCEEEEGAAA